MREDFLKEFRGDRYFSTGELTLTPHTFSYTKGQVADVSGTPIKLRSQKILVPVNVKDLIDMGFGEYVANETFTLFINKPLNIVMLCWPSI